MVNERIFIADLAVTLKIKIRDRLTHPTENPNQKYFQLIKPIVIHSLDHIPETTYSHLYIRKPDPYRHHVGDVDFYLDSKKYLQVTASLLGGENISGARIFDRADLDMIELYHPDVDVLAYSDV